MSGNEDEKNSSNRAEALKKIFSDVDLNKDQNLSFDEFHHFLSQKAGKAFSQELLTEIFRTIDRDKNSFLNVTEFIQGFTKAETIILNQIKQLKSQIQETSEAYTKTQRNLLEAKVKKMQNIEENNLYVVVKRAEALKAVSVTGNRAPMVCITCEGLETSTSPVQNPTNPEWNQSFTIPILVGTGDILIEVYDTDKKQEKDKKFFLGEVVVPLRALANQDLHEDFLELIGGPNRDRVQGKILLAFQWIHDLPLYLEKLIKENEENLKSDKAELENLENFLKELLSPIKTTNLPDWIKNNERIEGVERIVSDKVMSIFDKTLGKTLKWQKMTALSVYSFLLLSIITCFMRTDFFNVRFRQLTLSVASLVFFVRQLDLALYYRVLTAGILLSEVLDLFWIWNYFTVRVMQTWIAGAVFFKITAVTSVVNLVTKIVFAGVFWKNSIDLS